MSLKPSKLALYLTYHHLSDFAYNKLGYFYVTAMSIIMEGYQQINSLG